MNCYDFELNITPFLEGELKQKNLTKFRGHSETCAGCKSKLDNIKDLINRLNNIKPILPPNDFTVKLHNRINHLNSRKLSKKWNPLDLLPFGMRPLHTFAFGFSLIVVIASSFMLLNVDKVPAVNMSKHKQMASPGQFRKMPHQTENQGFYTQSTHQDTMSRDSLENPQNLIESSPSIHLVKKNK